MVTTLSAFRQDCSSGYTGRPDKKKIGNITKKIHQTVVKKPLDILGNNRTDAPAPKRRKEGAGRWRIILKSGQNGNILGWILRGIPKR